MSLSTAFNVLANNALSPEKVRGAYPTEIALTDYHRYYLPDYISRTFLGFYSPRMF